MATIRTSLPILDSAGKPANGKIYFEQSNQYVAAEGLVTTARGIALITGGQLTAEDGNSPLVIPTTPTDQIVTITQQISVSTPAVWTTQIPDLAEVEYSNLPR